MSPASAAASTTMWATVMGSSEPAASWRSPAMGWKDGGDLSSGSRAQVCVHLGARISLQSTAPSLNPHPRPRSAPSLQCLPANEDSTRSPEQPGKDFRMK